jgi:hypothetical protein
MGVAVAVGEDVSVAVAVGEGTGVPVGVAEDAGVSVGFGDGSGEGVPPLVGSEIAFGVGVGVLLGGAGVPVGVEDGTRVSVNVGDGSGDGDSPAVGSGIAVGVGVADVSTIDVAVAVWVGASGVTLDVEVGLITTATDSGAGALGASICGLVRRRYPKKRTAHNRLTMATTASWRSA